MYKVSRDYEKLFSMLCAGEAVVGWVDYVTYTSAEGEDHQQRDVVQIRRHGEYDIVIGVRGLCYGSIYPFHQKNGSESSLLAGLCESLNLEWIEPTIPRATAADKGFNPDWSLPEATAESLRDHMALLRAAQESERRFRATVAAALRELHDLILDRHETDFRGDTQNELLDAVDTIIAKLGLEATEAPSASPE